MPRPRQLDESGADARERLLRAGTSMVLEHFASERPPVADTLRFVNPSSVASAAGVSKAMLYHYWSDFASFIDDVSLGVLEGATRPEELVVAMDDLAGDAADIIEALADHELDRLARSAAWKASVVLAVQGVGNPSSPFVWENLSAAYAMVLPRLGRRVRPPFDLADLARALSALAQGHAFLRIEEPVLADTRVEWHSRLEGTSDLVRHWNLFHIGVEATLLAMTEPVAPLTPG